MAAPTTSRELIGPYTEALLAYLRDVPGSDLSRARELGSAALSKGLGAAEICAIHHESLRLIRNQLFAATRNISDVSPASETDPEDTVAVAGAFLAETLMVFAADQTELRLLNTALRRHNDRLEGELRRVSRIMYDEALQLVSATRLALAAEGEPPPAVWDLLEQLEGHLAACSGSLQPRLLEDLGLPSAIQFLARRFAAVCRLEVTAEAVVGPMPARVGVALYRIILEALTNVHRHARANQVRIRVCEECSMIRCSIRDDGIGFDMSRTLPQAEIQGSGLVLMQESLRLVGGTLVVDSVPGGGTELRISICPRMQD